MSRRGHRAALPPAGFRAEPPLAADGLVVTVVNSEGHEKRFDFEDLPVPAPMRGSLAAAFAAQSRGWHSHRTADNHWRRLAVFARFLAELEQPPEDLDGLTAAVLKRWRALHVGTNSGRAVLASVRLLLWRDGRLGSGPVAEELSRRIPHATVGRQSYGEAERDRVLLAATRQFRAAWMRIRENTLLLERWRAGELTPESREGRIGRILDGLALTGDVPRLATTNGRAFVANRHLLGGSSRDRTWGRLFLTRGELTALAVLLTDRFGWNLSVYNRVPAPTRMPSAGETTTVTYQVRLEKHRSGSGRWYSTENITDSGAGSDGRLITQALEATVHGRALATRLAPGTDLLMTARTGAPGRVRGDLDHPRPLGPLRFGVTTEEAKHWAKSHGLGGSPFQRVRRTTVTREGRPLQHTQGTHESVYVLPDHDVRLRAQAVVADGAREALELARAAVFGGRLATVPDPAHQETATADCEDETASPWPAPRGGCGADFLLCLACPNAHVHPGHHSRLALLHQRVLSLRSALPDPLWQQRWRDHLLRLDDLREKVGPAPWNAALLNAGDRDRVIVDLLLKEDLAP
ncbi:hypothetical protein P3T27_005807 [Kitasatospora sp. MAA19]|uniref:hypothetical protein n=1 Tax=unclassified Kitasatospora TaxID=2633591 RepID=UPI002476E5B5|nr:hypothetical protein [Kitasatospora sp. MAA19]MDH6709061.1 hypothetical protein [Kitasatospora sp. MAA19]